MKTLILSLFTFLFLSFSLSAQHGLKAEYYDGTNFNRKVATRIDEKIDRYWNDTPPVEGIDPHECSIRWTGRLKAPESGTYTFSARVDDGIRVWVGGIQVIDDWQLNDVGIFEGKVHMEAGKLYDLKVEYFNALIEGEITLLWEIPDEEKDWFSYFADDNVVIGPEFFFQPPSRKVIPPPPPPPPVKPEKKKATPAPKPKPPPPPAPKPEKPALVSADTIQKYIPENVYFERAKADILEESYPELDELAALLKRQMHLKVRIEGHTDYVGDAYKNIILSQDRADAVAAYLSTKGVDGERLTAKGYGGGRPIVKNDGRKYHPENRRVEFVIE